ncbi:MAG TPA: DUF4097 family beta strand repeat-containing protein [Bacilli bacterium]|nr:DUF4097 family beta strand repeat-containing protein [Bacilli bacterium]
MKLNKSWGIALIILACLSLVSAANHFFQPGQYLAREAQQLGEQFGHNMTQFGQNMDQFGRNMDQVGNMIDGLANGAGNLEDWYGADIATKQDTQQFPAAGVTQVSLDNQFGKVNITGDANAKQITIKSTKRLHRMGSEEEMGRYFDDVVIETEKQGGGELSIRTQRPDAGNGFHPSMAVDYDIIVPPGVELHLLNNVGELTTTGMLSTVDAEVNVGKLDINGYKGTLRLKNNTGEINARGGKNITNVDVETNIGAINLYLPADANLQVDAETNIGDLETQFSELAIESHGPNKRIEDKLGDGQGTLHAHTNTGAIEIRKE